MTIEWPAHALRLQDSIKAGSATIGIIGMGYVGLPLAVAFGEAGCPVLAFDLDDAKIAALKAGQSYINHIEGGRIAPLVRAGTLDATADLARLGEPDVLLICVPTPLSRHLEPDLKYVEDTTRAIAATLRTGQLVILESTTYPGTTREVMQPILEAGGLAAGHDFFLAYSPEREDPGNATYSTTKIPKVVGADDPISTALSVALYAHVVPQTIAVSSAATAEAVKITENVFRAVNIALVNELKLIFTAMDIDVWEVIDAAKSKPFGFMPFYPGPGLGGHCIPIDPFYLTWKAREFNQHTRFIELAGQINADMPQHVVRVMADTLDARFGRGLRGARILVLGVAYKKNVDDIRESPSLRLMEMIEARGATADFHDPHVAQINNTREHPTLNFRHGVTWDLTAIADYDAVLIATDHDGVDYAGLVASAKLVIDTRNACARAGVAGENIMRA
ncbi:nucleotide sugar dehydrogenase [Sphingomonas hengshuiensis]|uniref:UDP-N-acetyl-D-glucosamine dehydrogenase n=1 Tax=Sphingomonas hengshuiensis TaxID=1609977 RepID=A0A7U4J998_9SPHN|nr:nucleotide sugar dehydrogenase [Sphingomonas hengshuiensis]AJP72586.1 UDP-N-acetyl-D-glucosamine dehydrogenase [Sphingomonas hengshuiensis]